MKTNKLLKKSLIAGIAVAGLTSIAAQAYGPLYIFDYTDGTPYRWDERSPYRSSPTVATSRPVRLPLACGLPSCPRAGRHSSTRQSWDFTSTAAPGCGG